MPRAYLPSFSLLLLSSLRVTSFHSMYFSFIFLPRIVTLLPHFHYTLYYSIILFFLSSSSYLVYVEIIFPFLFRFPLSLLSRRDWKPFSYLRLLPAFFVLFTLSNFSFNNLVIFFLFFFLRNNNKIIIFNLTISLSCEFWTSSRWTMIQINY